MKLIPALTFIIAVLPKLSALAQTGPVTGSSLSISGNGVIGGSISAASISSSGNATVSGTLSVGTIDGIGGAPVFFDQIKSTYFDLTYQSFIDPYAPDPTYSQPYRAAASFGEMSHWATENLNYSGAVWKWGAFCSDENYYNAAILSMPWLGTPTFEVPGNIIGSSIYGGTGSFESLSVQGRPVFTSKDNLFMTPDLSVMPGSRLIGVGSGGWGSRLTILAGGSADANHSGGDLILSSGEAPTGGNTGSNITFKTASSSTGSSAQTRMTLNRYGALGIGSGSLTGIGVGWEASGGLDVAWGGGPATILIGADLNSSSRTNGQTKYASIACAPRDFSKANLTMMAMENYGEGATLSIGGGQNNGATDILFYTAPTSDAYPNENGWQYLPRLKINRFGGISAGNETVATWNPDYAGSQFVVGKYNKVDHTGGSFVVGTGTGPAVEQRKNALRVDANGAVLIQPSGDISMGEFTAGEQP